jgi:hypothetical protein
VRLFSALLILLVLPSYDPRETLELYDVRDISWSLDGFPGVDISLAGEGPDVLSVDYFYGYDLADELRAMVAEDPDRIVTFQSGLIFIRGDGREHAQIVIALTGHRVRLAALEWLNRELSRALPYVQDSWALLRKSLARLCAFG